MAALESEVRSLRQSNAKLNEDNKAAATMIRNKDRELDAAALRVEEAERVMIMNGVRALSPLEIRILSLLELAARDSWDGQIQRCFQ